MLLFIRKFSVPQKSENILLKLLIILVLPLFLLGSKSPTLTSITVTNPSGGNYLHGDEINITWESSGMSYVDIELWRNGSRERILVSNLTNIGSHSWTIPTDVPISFSSNYQIKVFEVERETIFPPGKWPPPYVEYTRTGVSDVSRNFKIVPESITVYEPSGTSIREGNNLGIIWSRNYSTTSNVSIELFKGSSKEATITSSTNNDGFFNWTIPENSFSEGSNYKIKVAQNNASPSDFSGNFTITTNKINFTSHDNKNVTAGDPFSFSWDHNLNSGSVDLDYKIDAGNWTNIATLNRGTTSYTWNTLQTIGTARIRIRGDNGLSYVKDFINNIKLTPEINVTGPSGKSFFKRETLSINWSSNYTIDYVDVVLLRDGEHVRNLANNAGNEGSLNWTIPHDVEASSSSNYQIRVYEVKKEIVYPPDKSQAPYFEYNRSGVSDGVNFKIVPQTITVSSPSSSVSRKMGESVDITWDANILSDYVNIELLDENGSHVQSIETVNAENQGDSGFYSWDLPAEAHNNYTGNEPYKIRISSADGVAVGVSDLFTVLWYDYIKIFEPGGAVDHAQPGETIDIRWATNLEEVNILLETANRTSTIANNYSTTTSPPDNTIENSIDWTAPTAGEGQYRILISGGDKNTYSGFFKVGKGIVHKTITYNNYDSHGNVIKATNANGEVIHLYYGTNSQPKTQSTTGINGAQGVYLTGIRKEGSTNLDQTATYNALGQVETVTAPNGNTQTFTYDGLGRLDVVKNNAGQTVTEHTYTVQGSNFSSTNPNWIQTKQHTGSDTRHATEYIDGLERTIQTQQRVGTNDIVSTTTYDDRGRKHKAYKPYSRDTNHNYDSNFNSEASSFYSGVTGNGTPYAETQYEDSPMDRPVKTIPTGGESVSGLVTMDYDIRSWNGNNYKVTTTTDESGKVTETWTDAWGRKVKTVAAPGTVDEAVTIFKYDELGNLKKVTAPNNTETTYDYNAKGELVGKKSADAGRVRHIYDKAGNLRFTQDANGAVSDEIIFTSYDNRGRPTVKGIVDENFAELEGDATYSFESQNANFKGSWAYDTKPSTSSYPWSKFASLIDSTTVTNPRGQLVARAWRYAGNKITESATIEGVGVVEDETYKAAGNIEVSNTIVDTSASLTLESGDSITLKSGFHAEQGSQLNASIDPNLSSSNSTGISSLTGSNPWQMELYSYDQEGRVKEKWIWTGDRREWDTHLAYEYNRLGEVTRQKIEVGSEVLYQHYTYNQRGLLDKVYLTDDGTADTEPAEITYTYTASGAVDQITYRNGNSTVTNGYDIRGRLTEINDINSTSGSPFAAKYEYKNNSNVDKAHFWNPNITTGINLSSSHRKFTYDYSYDDLSRLADADYQLNGSNPSAFDVPLITYDEAGNIDLLQRRDQEGNLVDDLDYKYLNGNNQLSSITDNASSPHSWDPTGGSFTYDSNGNLTSMTGNPELSDIAYDHRNLPVHMYLPDSTEQINNYNADGQRILKEVKTSSGSTWSFYIQDGLSTLGVIQGGELQYLNILADGVSGRVVANNGAVNADNAKRYYLKDLIGSTRAVVDENGTTTENRDYYPFGLLMDERQYVQGAETTEKFSGKERDEQTGFDYFGARYYMPGIGRFLSTDRFADKYPTLSTYQYAANNPTLLIDVNGDSVDVSHLDSEDLNVLKNSLSDITGLDLYVEDGYLLSSGEAKDKDGSSKTASSWFTNAINSKNVSNVYYQKKGKKGSSSINDNIYLDPVDIEDHKWAISGDLDPRTMGWGMTFLHELNHTSLVPGGPYEDNAGKNNPTGDVVDRLNKVRRELGPRFGQRKNYVPRFISEESYFNYIDFGKGRKIIRPPRTYEFNNEY